MKNRSYIGPIIIILTGISVFSYIAYKSTVSSFTHDESYTYLHFVSQSFMDIISNQGAFTNNHVLNTLFMKYSEILFGNSEIALRLPNLLMFLALLFYTWLLFRKKNQVIAVSIFVLMSTNTALTDFFGLARGYGLSIGFMVMSIYHLISSFANNKKKHLVLFNLAALLAILSSFTMLSYFVSALLVFNLVHITESRFITKEKFSLFKQNKVNIILFFFLLIVLYEPVRKAIKFNQFDFGGKQGFVTDTITSLIYHTFTNVHLTPGGLLLLQISILALVFLSFIVILINTYIANKEFFSQNRSLIIVNIIILCLATETILQHYIVKTDYLVGRFSLFFLPLLILNLGFLFQYLLIFRYRFLSKGFIVILAILSVSTFYTNKDLYSCADWGYDMETRNAVEALVNYQHTAALKPDSIRLGINWVFEPTINFYIQTRKIKWLSPVDRNGFTEKDDYRYIFMADSGALKRNHEVIFSSGRTNTLLIRVR